MKTLYRNCGASRNFSGLNTKLVSLLFVLLATSFCSKGSVSITTYIQTNILSVKTQATECRFCLCLCFFLSICIRLVLRICHFINIVIVPTITHFEYFLCLIVIIDNVIYFVLNCKYVIIILYLIFNTMNFVCYVTRQILQQMLTHTPFGHCRFIFYYYHS